MNLKCILHPSELFLKCMPLSSIFIHDEVKSHYSIILSLISDVTELLLRYSLPVIISISMRYKERERGETRSNDLSIFVSGTFICLWSACIKEIPVTKCQPFTNAGMISLL